MTSEMIFQRRNRVSLKWLISCVYVIIIIIFLMIVVIDLIYCRFEINKNRGGNRIPPDDTDYYFSSKETLIKHINEFYGPSNLELREYKCSGSCYCVIEHDQSERRRIPMSSTSVRQRLVYFVSVMASSLMAYKISKNYFEEECEEILTRFSCSQISSEVEDCEPVVSGERENNEEEGDVIVETKKNSNFTEWYSESNERSFFCSGRCVRLTVPDFLVDMQMETLETQTSINQRAKMLTEELFACEKIELSQSLKLPMKKESVTSAVIGIAETHFMMSILNPLCLEQSMASWSDYDDDDGKKIPFCMGYRILPKIDFGSRVGKFSNVEENVEYVNEYVTCIEEQ